MIAKDKRFIIKQLRSFLYKKVFENKDVSATKDFKMVLDKLDELSNVIKSKDEIFGNVPQDHKFYYDTKFGKVVFSKEGERARVIFSDHFFFPVGKLIRMNKNTRLKVNY